MRTIKVYERLPSDPSDAPDGDVSESDNGLQSPSNATSSRLHRFITVFDPKNNTNVSDPMLSPQHMLTHFPRDDKCRICNECRLRSVDHRRTRNDSQDVSHAWIEPTSFAQLLTADHKIVGEKNPEHESKDNDRVALVILDFATRYIVAYPAESRETHEVVDAFRKFLGCANRHIQRQCRRNHRSCKRAERHASHLHSPCALDQRRC